MVVLVVEHTTHAGDTQEDAEDIHAADTPVVRGVAAAVGAVVTVVELEKPTCYHPLRVTSIVAILSPVICGRDLSLDMQYARDFPTLGIVA
jgi:hypothetical protein